MAKAWFELRGLDEYLQTLVQAGEDIDQVVTDVLDEAREPAGGTMFHFLRMTSESWTGDMAKAIVVSPVQQDGNYIFIELGNTDPGAFYKEYGRPRAQAEPFLRPTLDFYRKREIKRLMAKVLEQIGAAA